MFKSLKKRIRVEIDDITQLDVDAIVNAANSSLLGGGGVDGAIHRAAGPELLAQCRTLGGCKEGEAKITGGYMLAAKHVIHTVGPVWDGGAHGEPELLAGCYRSSLQLASENAVHTIAFPCISTGVFGYPQDEACKVAVTTVIEWLRSNELPKTVTFCCFSDEDADLYRAQLSDIFPGTG